MPTYEYECSKCQHHFDTKQKFSDEAVASCPKCHSQAKRIFCPSPIVFKGSGFYVTDYRSKGSEANSCPAPGPKPAGSPPCAKPCATPCTTPNPSPSPS